MRNNIKNLLILFLVIIIIIQFTLMFSLYNATNYSVESYKLINPDIAAKKSNEFKEIQDRYAANLYPLRQDLQNFVNQNLEQNKNISIYIEHLNSGVWIGVNEKNRYSPGSLMKLPNSMCVMKKIEDSRDIDLNTKAIIRRDHIDSRFGSLAFRNNIVGKEFTLKDLMIYSLGDSDNTAASVIREFCSDEEFIQTVMSSGFTDFFESERLNLISTKSYSNFFRILYNSGYLKRANSDFLLSVMANSPYNDGIPNSIDNNIIISHKIGIVADINQYHDCGIVYANDNPFLICIMTRGYEGDRANNIISEISRITYLHMKEN